MIIVYLNVPAVFTFTIYVYTPRKYVYLTRLIKDFTTQAALYTRRKKTQAY